MKFYQSTIYLLLFFLFFSCSNSGKESNKENKQSSAEPTQGALGTVSMAFNFGESTRVFDTIPLVEGQSLFYILEKMKNNTTNFNIEDTLYSGLGHLIVGFENIRNQSPNYWVYCINGIKANRGVDDIELKNNDVITWYYTSDMNPCK